MDPLSAVANITQLAEVAFKILKILETIKEGIKDRANLRDEIGPLWMTLRNLEDRYGSVSEKKKGAWTKPIDSLAEPNGVLNQLSKA